MRRHWILGSLAGAALAATVMICGAGSAPLRATDAATQPAATQAADNDQSILTKGSYALGLNIGINLMQEGVDVDADAFVKGLREGITGQKPTMAPSEINAALKAFQDYTVKAKEEKDKVAAAKNLTEGQAFMEKNKAKAGVKTTPSGLQYEVLKSGTGAASPKDTDSVKANYKGTLIDGTQFDSSYDRGEPAIFSLERVIPGWIEAMKMMKIGDKWKLVIPPSLAYGPNGKGPIGPNSTLIFEVELLEINPPMPALPPGMGQ